MGLTTEEVDELRSALRSTPRRRSTSTTPAVREEVEVVRESVFDVGARRELEHRFEELGLSPAKLREEVEAGRRSASALGEVEDMLRGAGLGLDVLKAVER